MADTHWLYPTMTESSVAKSVARSSANAAGAGGRNASQGADAGGGGGLAGSMSLLVPAAFATAGLAFASFRYAYAKSHRRAGGVNNWTNDGVDPRGRTPPPGPGRAEGGAGSPRRLSGARRLAQQAAAAYGGGGPHDDLGTPPRAPPPPAGRRRVSPAPARSPPGSSNSSSPASPNSTAHGSGSKWTQGKLLGGGTFGEVFLGRHVKTGQMAAIKVMKRLEDAHECEKEFKLLKGLPRHPFVVSIYGVERDRPARNGSMSRSSDLDGAAAAAGDFGEAPNMRLVLEYCPNGALSDVLKRDGPCGEALLRSYARQILLGLAFLHRHNIIHRDIKPANILIDASGRLKLTDFGMSRHLDTMHSRTSLAGSPAYMSPEAIQGRYFAGTDLWAVGATLTQMGTGKTPWSHVADRDLRHPHALMHYIAMGPASLTATAEARRASLVNHHPQLPPQLSPSGVDFFKRLFAFESADRGTCEELLRHPWIVNGGSCPVTVDTCFLHVGDAGSSDDDDNDDNDDDNDHTHRQRMARATTAEPDDQSDTTTATANSGSMRGQAVGLGQQLHQPVRTVAPTTRPLAGHDAALDVEISDTTAGGSSAPSRATTTTTNTTNGSGSGAGGGSGGPHFVSHTQTPPVSDEHHAVATDVPSSPSDQRHGNGSADTPSSFGNRNEDSQRTHQNVSSLLTNLSAESSSQPHGL